MKKKSFTFILLLVALLLISVTSYANDMNLGNEIQDSANKTGESMQDARNGVMNFANDVGNGIRGTAENIGNSVQNFFNGDNSNTTTGSNYNAALTSAEVTGGNGMASTAWIWLILGVTGIIIVALTWYYVSQDGSQHSRR